MPEVKKIMSFDVHTRSLHWGKKIGNKIVSFFFFWSCSPFFVYMAVVFFRSVSGCCLHRVTMSQLSLLTFIFFLSILQFYSSSHVLQCLSFLCRNSTYKGKKEWEKKTEKNSKKKKNERKEEKPYDKQKAIL